MKYAVGCAVGGVLLIGLVLILALALSYNSMVGKSQEADKAWAQVQNVYQRRADLVSNLVQTVAGAANFEKSTLIAVTEARASVGRVQLSPSTAPTAAAQLQEFEKSQGALSSALSRLMVVAEKYPDLKANANFQMLQVQLEGTENRIAVERGKFNEAVQAYNTSIKSVPAVFFAGLMGFQPKPYFSAVPGAEVAPKVQFDFSNTPSPAPAR